MTEYLLYIEYVYKPERSDLWHWTCTRIDDGAIVENTAITRWGARHAARKAMRRWARMNGRKSHDRP